VVDDQGTLIAFEDTARVLRGENVQQIAEVSEFIENPSGTSDINPELTAYTGLTGETVVGSYVPLGAPQWAVVTELPVREAYQPIVRTLVTSGLVILLFAILVGLAGNILARRLSNPLIELSGIASEVSGGNLGVQAKVTGPSEISQLATTFNTMTSQLRDLIGGLEQRVADRTHDLELAAEVGRTVTGKVTQVSEMLAEAVEMIRARFNLYYTQIYLADPSKERLILRAGTGDIGSLLLQRGHNLTVNSGSLNGRAVLEKRAQIVADTAQNPTFLPNPLLPNTHSEMSIPLILEGNVVGVLDMQSEQPGALSESNLPAFEALAGQLAIAVRNATLFAEVQEARAEVETQMTRFTEQGWEDFLNAIDQEHRIGYAFDNNQVARLQLEALSTDSRANGLNLPVNVTGVKVGEIQIPANLKSNELELVSAISEQLAQHVENLRLLAQAETFRKEAELAVRRLTHEGWETYLSNNSQMDTGYMYDLNQVQRISENNNPDKDQSTTRPLIVRDEPIGELKLDLPELSEEASEILSAVAEQLSGHLENLRLSELNERHAQREQTLRQITSALRSSNNPTTIMRTAVRELGSILGRRAVIQMVTPEKAGQGAENETNTPANPDGAVGGKE
jgi:GAF domain-containing protein